MLYTLKQACRIALSSKFLYTLQLVALQYDGMYQKVGNCDSIGIKRNSSIEWDVRSQIMPARLLLLLLLTELVAVFEQ